MRQQLEEEQGQEFYFETIIVDCYGKETNRNKGSARQKVEDLGNGVNLNMVYIPSGTFMMGSPEGEGNPKERPQHRVNITQPLYISKYLITQEQYQAVMNENPSSFKGDGKLPVHCVTWRKVIEFCANLSKMTGKNYTLPSETQWEYACRAETQTPFHGCASDKCGISN